MSRCSDIRHSCHMIRYHIEWTDGPVFDRVTHRIRYHIEWTDGPVLDRVTHRIRYHIEWTNGPVLDRVTHRIRYQKEMSDNQISDRAVTCSDIRKKICQIIISSSVCPYPPVTGPSDSCDCPYSIGIVALFTAILIYQPESISAAGLLAFIAWVWF